MNCNIPRNSDFAKRARDAFEESGIPVAEWARDRGFSASLVYQVLDGKRKCMRDQSHRIAVALGLKDGLALTLEQLITRLTAKPQGYVTVACGKTPTAARSISLAYRGGACREPDASRDSSAGSGWRHRESVQSTGAAGCDRH